MGGSWREEKNAVRILYIKKEGHNVTNLNPGIINIKALRLNT